MYFSVSFSARSRLIFVSFVRGVNAAFVCVIDTKAERTAEPKMLAGEKRKWSTSDMSDDDDAISFLFR